MSVSKSIPHVLLSFSGCWCDPVGSIPPQSKDQAPGCHPRSGQCHCKTGVGGASCNQCLSGYWAFGPEGCKPCACPLKCDALTGHCIDRSVLFLMPWCHRYLFENKVSWTDPFPFRSAKTAISCIIFLLEARSLTCSTYCQMKMKEHGPKSWQCLPCTIQVGEHYYYIITLDQQHAPLEVAELENWTGVG